MRLFGDSENHRLCVFLNFVRLGRYHNGDGAFSGRDDRRCCECGIVFTFCGGAAHAQVYFERECA
mgnify:CR=1 FL=1